MGWNEHILVVALEEGCHDSMLEALRDEADSRTVRFTVVVPARAPTRAQAEQRLTRVIERARNIGLVLDGRVGPPNPLTACLEAFDSRCHDQIIVSVGPRSAPRWASTSLPVRIRSRTDVPVRLVEAPATRAKARVRTTKGGATRRAAGQALS